MAENTDVVWKVGRGGAGNEDLEAQDKTEDESDSNTEMAESQLSSGKYSHAGRGGAGNHHEPSTNEPLADITRILTSPSTASGPASNPPTTQQQSQPRSLGISMGRGGAGNWFETAAKKEKREAEEERRRQEEVDRVERMVRESIEAKLTKPERSYLGCGTEKRVRIGKTRVATKVDDGVQ